jgi:hypothetical protein
MLGAFVAVKAAPEIQYSEELSHVVTRTFCNSIGPPTMPWICSSMVIAPPPYAHDPTGAYTFVPPRLGGWQPDTRLAEFAPASVTKAVSADTTEEGPVSRSPEMKDLA